MNISLVKVGFLDAPNAQKIEKYCHFFFSSMVSFLFKCVTVQAWDLQTKNALLNVFIKYINGKNTN